MSCNPAVFRHISSGLCQSDNTQSKRGITFRTRQLVQVSVFRLARDGFSVRDLEIGDSNGVADCFWRFDRLALCIEDIGCVR